MPLPLYKVIPNYTNQFISSHHKSTFIINTLFYAVNPRGSVPKVTVKLESSQTTTSNYAVCY